MAPPLYADLGKQARDIFGKGFHFGLVKLDVKTKTNNGLEISSSGQSITDLGKVSGSLEGKYKNKQYGATLTSKWSTDNVIASKLEFQDALTEGLKLTLDTKYNHNNGVKDGKVSAELRHDFISAAADVDLNLSGPIISASAVLGKPKCGWLAGYQMTFDTAKSKLIKNNIGIALDTKDFVLHANVNEGMIFGGSLYKKVHSCCEMGLTLGWTASTNIITLGVGSKYVFDQSTCARVKVSSNQQVGLGLQQKLNDCFSITLSSLIDTKNFNQGGHKVGLAMEMEA